MAESVDVEIPAPAAPAARSGVVRPVRRERRPTGAPPPLPRKFGISGWLWLGLIVLVFVSTALFLSFQPTVRFGDHVDAWGLNIAAHLRTPWLTHLARAIKAACAGWALTVLALGTGAALMAFRRWRHLLVFLGSMFLLGQLGSLIYKLLTRPRPYGVQILGGWSGFSMPSPPAAVFSAILVGMLYSLVVPGGPSPSWPSSAPACCSRARPHVSRRRPSLGHRVRDRSRSGDPRRALSLLRAQ